MQFSAYFEHLKYLFFVSIYSCIHLTHAFGFVGVYQFFPWDMDMARLGNVMQCWRAPDAETYHAQ